MADDDRSTADDLSWIERLARDPGSFDFHVALRRFDTLLPARPRLGQAVRPADEPLRVGQAPSLTFQPTAVSAFTPGQGGAPASLAVGFLGLWGPHGPLPLHLTEYARDRDRHFGDRTLTRFLDVFHHRALLMFHRAWAQAQPTVSMDRPATDTFAVYVGACFGMGLPATRGRGGLPDRAKLFYAGRLLSCSRSAQGLEAIVGDYFGVPATVEEFVGDWMDLPTKERWRLGIAPETGSLGRTAVLGARVWGRLHKFRVVLGPLSASQFESTLPGSEALETLLRLVSLYTNDQWEWDVLLVLSSDAAAPLRLGSVARLGWTTRLGRSSAGGSHALIVDPRQGRTRRAPTRHVHAEGCRTERT